MTHNPSRIGLALAALMLAGSGAAHAGSIGTSAITPSTTLPFFACCGLQFTLDQINDGISNDAPVYNGFAARGITTGRITLTLDRAYDLDSFVLWNDINVLNEGVRSFKLEFVDAGGISLGSTGTLAAVSMFAPQTYSFASTVAGVKTVHMDVLSSNLQIEIRELAFNGVSAVPEPATVAMMLAGVAGLLAVRRTQRV
jgi:PEP-CTERM motif